MHRFAAELVVGAFVLLPVRACEARLMAGLSERARGAVVPIFDVEPARETHVLICKALYDVGKHRIGAVPRPAVSVLCARRNVRNRLIAKRGRGSNPLLRRAAPAARARAIVSTTTGGAGVLD